jgi:Ser-tRNA(Ala) deacylase AlaX
MQTATLRRRQDVSQRGEYSRAQITAIKRKKRSMCRPFFYSIHRLNNARPLLIVKRNFTQSSQTRFATSPNISRIALSPFPQITMASTDDTFLRYQHDGQLLKLQTKVQSVQPLSSLSEANLGLFKTAESERDFILTTIETIFHPQGGGQPSDEGTITLINPKESSNGTNPAPKLEMLSARHDAVNPGLVLHLVRFAEGQNSIDIKPGTDVELDVDGEKRLLYSRLHTAGHVLGGAVRHTVGDKVPNFDELKASHFPDSASCEFQGSIGGEHKETFQAKVNEFVKEAFPVKVEFWKAADFEREGLTRLIPENHPMRNGDDSVLRVVRIVGVDVYPCGGTHVDTTDLCGDVTVKKISRSKGNSRVSYSIK